MNATHAEPRTLANGRRDVHEYLQQAMYPAVLMRELERDWHYLRNTGQQLLDVFVERVYPRDNDQRFALHIRALVNAPGAPRWVDLWGEITGDDARQRTALLRERLHKRRRRQLGMNDLQNAVDCLPRLNMVVRLRGLDERIDGLKLVADHELAATELRAASHCESMQIAKRWTSELLAHRLGRRCVVRFRVDEMTADRRAAPARDAVIAKFYKNRSRRGLQVHDAMQGLWSNGWDGSRDVSIPQPLAYVAKWNCLVTEDCQSPNLHEMSDVDYVAHLPSVAALLRALHDSPIELAQDHYTAADEQVLISRSVALTSTLFPEVASQLGDILDALREALDDNGPAAAPHRLVHRDFYDKQILIRGDELILLDFDTLCVSDPALDIGNFLGHLHLAALQGHIDYAPAMERFVEAYALRPGDDFDGRVQLYTATTLLRVACLHFLWPPRQHLSRRLLEKCVEICR